MSEEIGLLENGDRSDSHSRLGDDDYSSSGSWYMSRKTLTRAVILAGAIAISALGVSIPAFINSNGSHSHDRRVTSLANVDAVKSYMTSLLTPPAGQTGGNKGLYAMWGNAFSDKEHFATVGVARPDNTKYTADMPIYHASEGKILTSVIVAKMIELGYFTYNTPLSSGIPTFTGSAFAFNPDSITAVIPSQLGNWTYSTKPISLDAFTVASCLQMNIPFVYPLFAYGTTGAIFLNTTAAPSAAYASGGMGKVEALQMYMFTKAYKNGYADVFSAIQDINSQGYKLKSTLSSTLLSMISMMKDGSLPALWGAGDKFTSQSPFAITEQGGVYGPSLEFLTLFMEGKVKAPPSGIKAYSSLTDFVRKVILDKMKIKGRLLPTEPVLANSIPVPEASFRRTNIPVSPFGAFHNDGPGTSDLYKLVDYGNTVWASQYPDDGLGLLDGYVKNNYSPNDMLQGGAPIQCSLQDFSRILRMIINGGEIDGERILSYTSIEWLIGVKSNGLTTMWYEYPLLSRFPTGFGWTGGMARVNRDATTLSNFPFTEGTMYNSGIMSSQSMFDVKTGNWFMMGSFMNTLGNRNPEFYSFANVGEAIHQAMIGQV